MWAVTLPRGFESHPVRQAVSEGWQNGNAPVSKTGALTGFRVRIPAPPFHYRILTTLLDVTMRHGPNDFTTQKYEMLRKTHSNHAPWTVIRSNDKHQARLNAMRVILNSVPYERGDTDIDFVPDPEIVISGSREVEQMEAERIRLGKFIG